jgi:membrane associated rhomboid family serine protease
MPRSIQGPHGRPTSPFPVGKYRMSSTGLGLGIVGAGGVGILCATQHAEHIQRVFSGVHRAVLRYQYAAAPGGTGTGFGVFQQQQSGSRRRGSSSSSSSSSRRNASRGAGAAGGLTASQGLLGLNVVMYALQVATKDAVTMLFAKVNPLIAGGQYWRLVSPALVHGNLMHLAVNCYSLWNIAPALEGLTGSPRMLVTYFVAALGGNVASYVMSPNPSLGASGAVFGLGGALAMYFYRNKNVYGRRSDYVLKSLWQTLLINVLYGGFVERERRTDGRTDGRLCARLSPARAARAARVCRPLALPAHLRCSLCSFDL